MIRPPFVNSATSTTSEAYTSAPRPKEHQNRAIPIGQEQTVDLRSLY